MTPKTRQAKKMETEEEVEGIINESETGSESSESNYPEDASNVSSEDPNFEISEDLLVTDDDDDLYDILSALFTTDEGENICTALMGIKDTLDTQNKLLLKIAMAVTKKK